MLGAASSIHPRTARRASCPRVAQVHVGAPHLTLFSTGSAPRTMSSARATIAASAVP
jgi:hypothetical protein